MSSTTRPGTASRHKCQCGKAFIRLEHLRRHMLTHSRGQYQCHICTRCFSRNDSLQRHIALHGSGRRLRRACDACRLSKRSCDRDDRDRNPCSLCISKKKACTFSLERLRGTGARAPSTSACVRDGEIPVATSTDKPAQAAFPNLATEARSIFNCNAIESVVSSVALDLLCEAIDSRNTGSHGTLQDLGAPPEAVTWFETCCQVFFERIHHRWPVIHYTSFDVRSDPLLLVVIVILLGCLVGKDSQTAPSKIYNKLVKELIDHLLRHSITEDQAWDFRLFQTMHLTALFGLFSEDEGQSKQADVFFSSVINTLRNICFFKREAMAYQEQHHYPATFIPFKMLTREKWRRLVANFYKLDAYLSLQNRRSPLLHLTELDAEFPGRFSLWNTDHLNNFYERLPDEPTTRQSQTINQFANRENVPMAMVLLPEDIELGLCSMRQEVWSLTNTHSISGVNITGTVAVQSLVSRLEFWKTRLDEIAFRQTESVLEGTWDNNNILFKAYQGKEDHQLGDAYEVSKGRLTDLISDAGSLYQLLSRMLLDPHDTSRSGETFWKKFHSSF